MAAKVATRDKTSTKLEENFERFCVVERANNKRVYLGEGVDQDTAERLASELVVDAFAVPVDQVNKFGIFVGDAAETEGE